MTSLSLTRTIHGSTLPFKPALSPQLHLPSLSDDSAIRLTRLDLKTRHMDIPNRRSHRPATKPSPSPSPSPTERFLGAYLHALPNYNNPSGDELIEADVLWSSNNFTSSSVESNNNRPTPPSSVSSTPRHHHHRHNGFSQPETFGILAALADRDESSSAAVASSPTRRNHSSNIYHHHKAAAAPGGSPSSPSYAQMIPKPPPPQDHHHHHRSFASSAPVNVPVMSAAMRMKLHELEALDDDVEDDDGEMLPPHEYVARSSSQSPMLACSVLEGVGRTLKGRDLRRVRNAIWRQTGFID